MGDELLVVPEPDGNAALEEVDELYGVGSGGKVKVNSLVNVLYDGTRMIQYLMLLILSITYAHLDFDAVDVCSMLEDELLEEEEGALVVHVLPQLDARVPAVWVRIMPVAVEAHVPFDDVFDNEGLLEDGAVEDLGLDGQLDLQALGVGLGPDESSIDKLHLNWGQEKGESDAWQHTEPSFSKMNSPPSAP